MQRYSFAIPLLFALASSAQTGKLSVKATIPDLKAGEWIYYHRLADTGMDSVAAVSGHFRINMEIEKGGGDIYLFRIGKEYTDHSSLLLYLDKGTLNIKGPGPKFKDAKLSGSSYVLDYNAYNDFVNHDPRLKDREALYKKANELYKNNDSLGLAKLQPELQAMDSVRIELSKKWVQGHPGSPISAFVLYFDLRRSMNFDELEKAYNQLSAAAKDNKPAADLAHSIEVNKLTGIGNTALDFTQNDTSGNPVSLHDFKGKYVLVDFWASWCHPCREENPNVVKAFRKFRDRNFTVLSVSLDQPNGKGKWLDAIHTDHLEWTHVSDLRFWNNAVAKMYDIGSIPSNLLIGPDGKILAKDLHGDELDKKLGELLGNVPTAIQQPEPVLMPVDSNFTISGKVEGVLKGMVYLSYEVGSRNYVQDSAVVRDGKFSFSGILKEPAMAYFHGRQKQGRGGDRNAAEFFIAPGNMEITMKDNDFSHAVLTGSLQENENARLKAMKEPIYKAIEPLSKAYEKANEALTRAEKEKRSEAVLDSLKYKAADIHEQFSPYFRATDSIDYVFFSNHPQSYVTAYQLRFHTSSLSLDSLQLFYDRLGGLVQQSLSGKEVASEIARLRAGSPGSAAPDFTTQDINGQLLTLSAFKGRSVVLVDFWASWCVPCRRSNPHMIQLFNQYHSKGLDVIGVADDDGKPEVWKKAVAKDGVGIWNNVLRGLDWDKIHKGIPNDKDISEKFGIHSLPTKILIDKNGVIVGRYGEEAADEAALDKKLAELL